MRTRTLWLGAALLLAGNAHALYRCGNVFQDRPCDGAAPTAPALSAPAQASPSPGAGATRSSPFAALCTRSGEYAQQVQWKREGGATLEQQLAAVPPGQRAELGPVVQSVYARRGSAPEIRAAIEAECVQRHEMGLAAVPARVPQEPSGAPAAPRGEAAAQQQAADIAARRKKATCDSLQDDRANVESRLRVGGSAQTMEYLQQQRRDVERRMSSAGC